MKKNYFKVLAVAIILCAPLLKSWAQDPVQINNVDDLRNMESYATSDATSVIVGEFILMADIDLSDIPDWLPIGKPADWDGTTNANLISFAGTFDGNHHTIKGLTIKGDGSSFYNFSALFARISSPTTTQGAAIRNLSLVDVNITGGGAPTGALGGVMFGLPALANTGCTIENVSVTGNIQGTSEVGGIIGRDNNQPRNYIRNCYVNATVEATADGVSPAYGAGGIVGCMNSGVLFTIEKSYVAGKVTANPSNYAAGIIGYTYANNNGSNASLSMENNAVVADEISGGTTNLFYNKGPLADSKVTLTSHARNDLDGFTDGTDAPEAFLTQDFYETTLGWDFTEIWQIKEGEFPIFKWQEYGVTNVGSVKAAGPWKIAGANNAIEVTAFEPLFLSVYDITGKKLFVGQVDNRISIPADKGIYILKLKCAGSEMQEKILVK